MSAGLEARVAEEQAKIKVDSYQKVASVAGWAGGGRTLWAAAAFCTVVGAAIGLVAPFFPVLAGASTLGFATSAIPASVLAFAATGLSTGFAGGIMLGRISGSAAAVGEELERRMKHWMVRQKISENPQAEIAPDAPKVLTEKHSFWQRAGDAWHTYVNPRIGLTMALIGAVGGLIMAGAFAYTGAGAFAVMPAMQTLTGLTANPVFATEGVLTSAAVTAYTVGVSAMMGAVFSFNVPKIASAMTEFTGRLIGGKIIGREWKPVEKNKPEAAAPPVEVAAQQAQAPVVLRRFESYQELVSRPADAPKGLYVS